MTDEAKEALAQEAAARAGFTVTEGLRVMNALARGQEEDGGKGFTEDDLVKAIDGVRQLRVYGVLANMVMNGEMLLQVSDEGKVRFLTAMDFDPQEETP